jgi:hypothetical protein
VSPKPLTHSVAGRAQVGLSYFFLAGFFALLVLEGLGYIKINVVDELGPITMLVMSFWFQRQRTSVDESPPATAPVPTEPPQAAQPKVS